MAGRDGHGTTITFGTTGFAAKIKSVGGPNMERGAIDVTTMDTTGALAYIAAALYDGGSVDITFQFDPEDGMPPINTAAETITIDWAAVGATWAFPGFMTAAGPAAAVGEEMQMTSTLKCAGEITVST